MGSDSNASSPTIESGGRGTQSSVSRWIAAMTSPKWLFVVVTLACPVASAFLDFLVPALSNFLFFIGLVCWIPMFFFFLGALFRRRWKAVAIFAAVWIVISLPLLNITEPFTWLRIQGFRIHVSPLESYLARCHLFGFIENGTKQAVGSCEDRWLGPVEYTVFYDTTRQFALPVSERTPAWKEAMSHFTPAEYLIASEGGATHLFGNFYLIDVNIDKMTGG
jgi:hypothetical protein